MMLNEALTNGPEVPPGLHLLKILQESTIDRGLNEGNYSLTVPEVSYSKSKAQRVSSPGFLSPWPFACGRP